MQGSDGAWRERKVWKSGAAAVFGRQFGAEPPDGPDMADDLRKLVQRSGKVGSGCERLKGLKMLWRSVHSWKCVVDGPLARSPPRLLSPFLGGRELSRAIELQWLCTGLRDSRVVAKKMQCRIRWIAHGQVPFGIISSNYPFCSLQINLNFTFQYLAYCNAATKISIDCKNFLRYRTSFDK
jgi:hypothetical protein